MTKPERLKHQRIRTRNVADGKHNLGHVTAKMASAVDIPMLIVSENSSSERRISPSWSIAQLKGRLEPVTGVPAICQRLSLKIGSQPIRWIEAADEDATSLAGWPMQAYAEIKVGLRSIYLTCFHDPSISW